MLETREFDPFECNQVQRIEIIWIILAVLRAPTKYYKIFTISYRALMLEQLQSKNFIQSLG
jgi:hypothetical protein